MHLPIRQRQVSMLENRIGSNKDYNTFLLQYNFKTAACKKIFNRNKKPDQLGFREVSQKEAEQLNVGAVLLRTNKHVPQSHQVHHQ